MNTPENEMRSAAQSYAARGWPVIPLHTVRLARLGDDLVQAAGSSESIAPRCSCGKVDCGSPAKHPRTTHGLKDATTDPTTITDWWKRWPDANVGVVTGATAGIVVIDIDPRHGGDKTLAILEAEYGKLTPTLEAATGGGGRHLIYQHPGGELRNRANIRPGIDIRGDGGYIVAPPSIHVSGHSYTWRNEYALNDIEPAPMPRWLCELLIRPESVETVSSSTINNNEGRGLTRLLQDAGRYIERVAGVNDGVRNITAFNLAGHLAAFQTDDGERLTEGQIVDLLKRWNHRNQPPLAEAELMKVIRSAMTNGTPRTPHIVHTSPQANDKQPNRIWTNGKQNRSESIKLARIEPYQPFPVHLLPDVSARFVSETADALGCDPAFVGLPVLATIAAAIGTTRTIELKGSWREYAIIWTAVVARSGTLKSPAFDAATAPLKHAQMEAMKQYDRDKEEYSRAILEYDRELASWRKRNSDDDPPVKPKIPSARRIVVSDTTIEALAPILAANPRGVLAARDELAGLVRGFNQYKAGGRGSDSAAWLELWRAGTVIVDRKTAGSLYVPRAAVSLTGTIQPGTLADVLTSEHWESGLAARLLLAHPPELLKRWSDRTPAKATIQQYEQLIIDLLSLQHRYTEKGPEPVSLPLTGQACEVWATWYDQQAQRIKDAVNDRQAAALAKLEAYAARFSLIFALVANPMADVITADDLLRGTGLADWFAHETERIYGLMQEGGEQHEMRQLMERIRRKGGVITPRDLMRSSNQYATSADAEAALEALVQADLGYWEQVTSGAIGGRPSKRFRLTDMVATEMAIDDAKVNAGEGDTANTPVEAGSDDIDTDKTLADSLEKGFCQLSVMSATDESPDESWGEI